MGARWVMVAMAALGASCGARTTLSVPPPAPLHPELALGAMHTCLLGEDGVVHCWGSSAQRGDDQNLAFEICDPLAPVFVPEVDGASHVSASQRSCGGYACAVVTGGTVRCWDMADPQKQGFLPDVGPSVDVRTSESFGCALGADGAVRCFGEVPFRPVSWTDPPVIIPGLAHVVGIAAASNWYPGHACALDASGAAFCWGSNIDGQLGDGTAPETSAGSGTPVRVQVPVGFVAITASGEHTCAVDVAGDAWCWGVGGVGDGTAVSRGEPTRVVDLPHNVVQIAAGAGHTCALLGDASVWCWGANNMGQLGNGTFLSTLAPVRVEGLGDTIAIGLGFAHTCAVERDRSVWCWGSNSTCVAPGCTDGAETGQLGVSGITQSPVPVRASW